jgi:hypothetical protein
LRFAGFVTLTFADFDEVTFPLLVFALPILTFDGRPAFERPRPRPAAPAVARARSTAAAASAAVPSGFLDFLAFLRFAISRL